MANSRPAAPSADCFYSDAYYYTDGSACATAWSTFDDWCWNSGCENTICQTTNDAYSASQWAVMLQKHPQVMQVPPEEHCYYSDAFYYSDGSDCADQWSDFDNACWWDETADQDLCSSVNDVYWAVQDYDGTIPGDECMYYDAYYYNDGSACADQWNAFDQWCWNDEEANEDLCWAVND